MKLLLRIGAICLCAVFFLTPGRAQDAQQPTPSENEPRTPSSIATPPPAPQTTANVTRPPAPPPNPVNSGGGFSIELLYWLDKTNPRLRPGSAFVGANSGDFDYPNKSKRAPGGILSIPTGKDKTLRISYFRLQGLGATTASRNLSLLGTEFAADDFLVSDYTIQNYKATWEYLTYYFGTGRGQIRVNTLWEIQYASIKTAIDAPLDPNASVLVPVTATATRSAFLPTFGIGLQNAPSRHFRWEIKGSGFGLPSHSAIWDAEATIGFRFGKLEILGGEKGYYFRTAPKKDEFFRTLLSGAYGGIRWYF